MAFCMDGSGVGVGDGRLALAFGVWVVLCLRERFLVKFMVATVHARCWSKILLQPEQGTGTSSSLTTPSEKFNFGLPHFIWSFSAAASFDGVLSRAPFSEHLARLGQGGARARARARDRASARDRARASARASDKGKARARARARASARAKTTARARGAARARAGPGPGPGRRAGPGPRRFKSWQNSG